MGGMSTQTITEFLEARISEDEKAARELMSDLEREIAESYAGAVDERGPFTPQRLLGAKMWAQFAGQSKWRNFAEGQNIAYLANPARVLAECAAKRAIIRSYNSCLGAERRADEFGPRLVASGMVKGLEVGLVVLASIYSTHTDYRPEWAL